MSKGTTKIFTEIARVVVGVVFIFSGFKKAIDFSGTIVEMQGYMMSFGLDVLFPLAFLIVIMLIITLFALGTLLLLGFYQKWTTLAVGLFMIFFTLLTLWVAEWQTFSKNVVLLLCAVFLIFKRERITPIFLKNKISNKIIIIKNGK